MDDTDARRRNHWVSHLARLARYKRPAVLHVVDALPRNASGKVMTTALRREYR